MGRKTVIGLTCIGVIAVSAAFTLAEVASGEAEPSLSVSLSKLMAADHALAIACYHEGYEMGQLAEAYKLFKEQGWPVPPTTKAILDNGQSAGCRL